MMMIQTDYDYDLHDNQSNDQTEVVNKIEQKPRLDRLDVGRLRQGVGHRQVDGGQHHHDRDVDGQAQIILVLPLDIYRRLIDRVHKKRRNIGHSQHTEMCSKCFSSFII